MAEGRVPARDKAWTSREAIVEVAATARDVGVVVARDEINDDGYEEDQRSK